MSDKYFGVWKNKILIYRNYVPQEYFYNEVGNVIVHNNALNRLGEIENFLDTKLARLKLKVQ